MNKELKFDSGKKVKGYLFNLIVYTDEDRSSQYLEDVVRPFTEKFPCRALFIRSTKKGDSKGIMKVTTPGEEDGESSDRFQIKVAPEELHRVPFAILPKLVPDLPVYLVWGDSLTADNKLLSYLEKLASRLVFDSEYADDLQEFSATMLEKISQLKTDFMDIGWAKISGWRNVLAQVFDSSDKIEQLSRCEKISIKYNLAKDGKEKKSAYPAIYLQAWLASQLGWEFDSLTATDPLTLQYQKSNIPLEVVLQPQERASLARGRIFEIEFDFQDGMTTMLTLAEKQSKVMVYVSTPEKCNLPLSYPIPDLSMGLTAMKEVFYHPTSEHYRKMLATLKKIPLKEF